jgi:hypothetical protein
LIRVIEMVIGRQLGRLICGSTSQLKAKLHVLIVEVRIGVAPAEPAPHLIWDSSHSDTQSLMHSRAFSHPHH